MKRSRILQKTLILRDLDLIKTFSDARVAWSINTLDEDSRAEGYGCNAVIGAGSVVTRDIPENVLAVGSPDRGKEVEIMPELPEVETIKRVIEPQIQGLSIERITVRRPEVVSYPAADEFCRLLEGKTVSHMTRRGKFLAIHFNSNDCVILHLRMTGCLLLAPADDPEEKHTHIIFHLDNGKELRFSDTRRFGRFWVVKAGEADTYSGIGKLGIEPLEGELTAEYLYAQMGKRRKAVKECLLDQGIVAGIGNIYSDEILFTAGIYPAKPADSLDMEEWERLAAVIPERISYFIDRNKITLEEYLETKGKDYRNTPFLQVYGHEGRPCPKCAGTLCRMVIGGRGSTYCPACQRDCRTDERRQNSLRSKKSQKFCNDCKKNKN